MLHAVIMAGGAGTRFWPASRSALPKQLLDLAGGQTMIQATVSRLGQLIPPERVLIVTSRPLVGPIARQLPRLSPNAIIGEPCRRDTAPCIGLAAILLGRHDADATMAVMPADHVIRPDDTFQQAIAHAAELVQEDPARIVTFGIPPSYPAESFGYIELGEPLGESSGRGQGPPTYRVAQFHEKPPAERARQYIEAGNFFWNSGIFVWQARTILQQLARHEPAMYEHLEAIAAAAGTPDYETQLQRHFTAIGGKSIDYAVLERADEVLVVQAPFEWDDVGSWQSLARLRGTDPAGNTIAGKHLSINTSGTIVHGPNDHLIVTVGMKDCIVVHTKDATLVANKHDEESVRQVVQLLREKGWEEYL